MPASPAGSASASPGDGDGAQRGADVPGFTSLEALTVDQVKVAMAAHGLSIVEVERVGRAPGNGRW
jgi:hypothetical protein